MKRLTLSKAEREAEAEAIRAALPKEPSEEVKKDFMKEPYENMKSTFRSEFVAEENGKKIKKVGVTCGWCREKSFYPYDKIYYGECCHLGYMNTPQDEYGYWYNHELCTSGHQFVCPKCFGTSTVYSYARMNWRALAAQDRRVQEIRAVNGHTVVMLWKLNKYIDRNGQENFWFDRLSASFQVGGRMFRAVGYENWYGNKEFIGNWTLTSTFREGIGGVDGKYTYFNENDLAGTAEGNDGLLSFLQFGQKSRYIYAERWLDIWSKAPNVENISKRWPSFVYCLIADVGHKTVYKCALECLDLKKTKPHEMLGIEKEEVETIISQVEGPKSLRLYRLCRKHGIGCANKALRVIEGQAILFFELLEDDICKRIDPPVEKLLNYCIKNNFRTRLLRDYWDMTLKTDRKVDSALMWPKDLDTAHDLAVEKFEMKKNPKMNAMIAERFEKLKKYCFSDKKTGLTIRPVRSSVELIKEGRELCHCVARYAKDVANGKTSIFFVRRTKEENTPFYTLEFKDGKIIQDHGFKNELQTPEVLEFEKHWLAWIKGGMKRGRKENVAADA